jgi:hypothetical protein
MKSKYYKHPITGKIIEMENGFNLPVLLLGWIYLFYKGDFETGGILLVLSIIGSGFSIYNAELFLGFIVLMLFVNIWVAIKWNKDYSEHLVQKGYKIIEETN